MISNKPTREDYYKLLQDGLTEDENTNNPVQLNEFLIKEFLKNILEKSFSDEITDNLINDIESELPYFLNEIELSDNVDLMLDLTSDLIKSLTDKGNQLCKKFALGYIKDLEEQLESLDKLNRNEILSNFINVNDAKMSSDLLLYGKHQDIDIFLNSNYKRLRDLCNLEPITSAENDIVNVGEKNLTAFEIALRHMYLVRGKAEHWIPPSDVGRKYSHLKSFKNIEVGYRQLEAKPRKREPKTIELQRVLNTLDNFPEIQKAIINDIDVLN